MKSIRVQLGEKTYEARVQFLITDAAELAAPAAAPAAPSDATGPATPAPAPAPRGFTVHCPSVGKLASIDVVPGQRVAAGAQIATIESMKMNTYVFAPQAGTVIALLATPGQGVDERSPLLQLE